MKLLWNALLPKIEIGRYSIAYIDLKSGVFLEKGYKPNMKKEGRQNIMSDSSSMNFFLKYYHAQKSSASTNEFRERSKNFKEAKLFITIVRISSLS